MVNVRTWALAFGVALGSAAHAADLGVRGPLYPIAEPHLLQEIMAALKAKEASGELAKVQAEALRRAQERIRTPLPVEGLARATFGRRVTFDPSVKLDQPIVDHAGRVIVAAGTVVNPLHAVAYRKAMVFFDARDPAQLRKARQLVEAAEAEALEVKPILVGGSPVQVMEQWQRRVFFDQGGVLVRKFGIKAVPATVRRAGDVLQVEEVPPT